MIKTSKEMGLSNMQNYDELISRFNDMMKKLKNKDTVNTVTKEEIIQLKNDMIQFVKENHPSNEKSMFGPLGLIESIGFILEDSNPDMKMPFDE